MLKTLPTVGDKVRYLGGETHENAETCLTVGKVYTIEQVVDGLEAILVSGAMEMSVFKDDSPEKYWTITEEEFSNYELIE